MKQHDYKAALRDIRYNNDLEGSCGRNLDTICHALLIADKLMSEPSEEMEEAGRKASYSMAFCSGVEQLCAAHKSMRDQMLKEISDGK